MSITLENPPPQMGKRKFRQLYKKSTGSALKVHRKRNMKHHFDEQAFTLYPNAYRNHYLRRKSEKRQARQSLNKNRVDDKFEAMRRRGNRAGILIFRRFLKGENITDEEYSVMALGGNNLTSKRARNRIKSKQKRNSAAKKRPLVQSGLLERMAINNPAKITGSAEFTSISIRGPFFLNLNPTQFNKREALTAINQAEELQITQVIDREIQKELDKIF